MFDKIETSHNAEGFKIISVSFATISSQDIKKHFGKDNDQEGYDIIVVCVALVN